MINRNGVRIPDIGQIDMDDPAIYDMIGQGKILVTASGYVYGTEYDIINGSG